MIGNTNSRLRRTRNWIPSVCLTALLTGNIGIARAQSSRAGPDPNLSLSANGRSDTQLYQGWPWIFEATVSHPDRFSKTVNISPLLINAQNGSWANTVQLVVSDANGVTQNWSVLLATAPSGSLTLDQSRYGRLLWTLAPAATATIAPGTYEVTAVLDTTASAGTTGWNGTTNSYSVSLQISPPPSPLTIDQQAQQAKLLANYDHLLGNDSQAIIDLDAFLNQQPNNVGALALRGDLLEQTGQTADALAAYDQAVDAFYAANPGPLPEAPEGLVTPQGRLLGKLQSQSGIRGRPQAAIQVVGQGVQSPAVFFLDLQVTNVGNDVAENVVLNQITFQTLSGTGQVTFNNILSPGFPVGTNFLAVNASAIIRVFVTVQGMVGDVSVTENGTAADIFGTPTSFSQTQTIFLNGAGGSPVALTITAPNATQVYGQPTPPLNNVTYNGFVNGDNATSLSGILSCITTATQSSPVGSYPITCSGLSSPNYTINYVPGTFSITPAALTVTANNTSRLYGQANPQFTALYNGFVNGDTAASLGGTLTFTIAATQSSPVGTYSISCAGLSSTNYAITFSPGQLNITPAPLTVTVNNASRLTGQPNPAFTVSYNGFVNGDTAASLSGTLSFTTTATQSSPAGTYPINCSGLSSTDYSITFVPGQLTITAPVCASDASSSVAIGRSGFSYNVLTKRYAQTVTLKNTGGAAIAGPIYLVLDSLGANAVLYNGSGNTSCAAPVGSPYVSIAGTLGAGASTNVVLQFTDPTNAAIDYTTRVLSGAGQP
jgi:hypothetical protein